ncbi:MAG: hypothetical protein P9L99_03335 [Candidatus Lernaella stagnicola]|nr:hypothetical protein [Candidatus Lernaella stagnicola]
MRHYSKLLLIVLIATVWLVGCAKTGPGDLPDYKRIKLNAADKRYTLALARHYVTGTEAPAGGKREFANVHKKSPRGVFLSVARPDDAALTAFGMGSSAAGAIKDAAAKLKKLGRDENWATHRLRLDVVERTHRVQQKKLDDGVRFDYSKEGLIFATNPPIALLPQELRDYGIMDRKKRFRYRNFKRLARQRGIPSDLRKQIDVKEPIKFAEIPLISFMENGKGGMIPLRRGNRIDGFEPTEENLLAAINGVGNYLKNAVKDDGSFEYMYYPQTDSLARSYNELRHAGTTFSMIQVYEINKDPELLESAKRALGWLERHTRGPDPEDSKKFDWKGLNNNKFQYAKLGGSGLSMLAFGWYTRATGDMQYLPLMQGYARFADYMMKPDGDVRMRYYYAPKDKDKKVKPVLYYPGEAFFGLATLYSIDGNKRWIDVGAKGVDFIADVRDKKKPDSGIPHDHWLAYAINRIHEVKPQQNHVDHAWRIFAAMDARFNRDNKDPDFNGGYYTSRTMLSSVSAACRLEATGALYRLAERLGDKAKTDEFFDVLQLGSSFLMRLQYNDINTMFFENPQKPQGGIGFGFWTPDIQIDYVQHSVSALIETYRITRERAGNPLVTEWPGALENREKKAANQ